LYSNACPTHTLRSKYVIPALEKAIPWLLLAILIAGTAIFVQLAKERRVLS